MEVKFDGLRAIVTGAGKGIGRALATKLAQCGAEVFALSRTQSDLDSLKSEVPTINIVQIDLSDWFKTRQTLQEIGPVDILVNNAGVLRLAPFLDMKQEDVEYVLDCNFNAVFNISQVVSKGMIEKGGGGSIVNISSIIAQKVGDVARCSPYNCSKAAVDMLTKCMAIELGPHNIRVNAVSPGLVVTNMVKHNMTKDEKIANALQNLKQKYPLGKFIEIEDVVNTVLFLLSDKSSSTHGAIVRVDGGYCVH